MRIIVIPMLLDIDVDDSLTLSASPIPYEM